MSQRINKIVSHFVSATNLSVVATRQSKDERVHVTFEGSDGGSSKSETYIYPAVWLRDNCQCAECLDPSALQRMKHPCAEPKIDLLKSKVSRTDSGALQIVWEDGHASIFNQHWLKLRNFTKQSVNERRKPLIPPVTWNANTVGGDGQIPSHNYSDVMSDDSALVSWLKDLRAYGLTVVKKTPSKKGFVNRLAERMGGFLKTTHYGHTFTVKSKYDPSNLAYSVHALPLHSDLVTMTHPPDVQLLHCLKQAAKGGENTFTDTFAVTEVLRKRDPEAFRFLTTVPVIYNDRGSDFMDFDLRTSSPVITLDRNGNFDSVHYSNHCRDSVLNLDIDQVEDYYKHFQTLFDMLNDPFFMAKYKMEDGDVCVFENNRVLHGRAAFVIESSAKSAERELIGCYVNLDMVDSNIRLATLKLEADSEKHKHPYNVV